MRIGVEFWMRFRVFVTCVDQAKPGPDVGRASTNNININAPGHIPGEADPASKHAANESPTPTANTDHTDVIPRR